MSRGARYRSGGGSVRHFAASWPLAGIGDFCRVDSTIAILHLALARFSDFQHLAASHRLRIYRDRATGKVMCFNPMVVGPWVPEGPQPLVAFYLS